MKKHEPNELKPEFLGVLGLNSFPGTTSSSRSQMFSQHITQALVIKGSTERRIQTGMEAEYAKYTYSVKMPVDAEIIKTIERYRSTYGEDTIAFSPQSIILYEDIKTNEIGMLNITRYFSNHQYFGFEYKPTPDLQNIHTGRFVPEGTILLNSPSVTENGGYKYGRECNIAYMTLPGVSEDGIIISRDVLADFGFKTYETRIVEYGMKRVPLNLYGTVDKYKPFPDIGEYIREDGILMATRTYDAELAVVEQSVHDLMEPDFIFDKLTYVDGPGGRIVDIRILHDHIHEPLEGIDDQPVKYDRSRLQFYQEIVAEYKRLKKERGDFLQLTPELHRQIVEALAITDRSSQHVRKLYRNAEIETWRIEFVIEYNREPTIGFKKTDTVGGKGVIVQIMEPEQMPVDSAGNRADIVMCPLSTFNRTNVGRLHEQYINASRSATENQIRVFVSYSNLIPNALRYLIDLEKTNPTVIDRAWDYLMGFYAITSPRTHHMFMNGMYKRPRTEHLAKILTNGIFLYMPSDNEPELVGIISDLRRKYPPVYGPVTYQNLSGEMITTKENVLIGSVYFIELEKTANDWTAVSSGKLQLFGVLGQITASDKYSQPSRTQAIRAAGESEIRNMVSYGGPEITAELLDRSNNPDTHRFVANSILSAQYPANIENCVDREIIPLGGSKPIMMLMHLAMCGGWTLGYKKFQPNWVVPQTK